tara:strand:+ start:210 stop:800 length:591 start_codon:yes stop_codon:yes gene_type:complete
VSFRKEYKISATRYEVFLLKNELIKKGMVELHPPRKVISNYFDTNLFQMFNDSEEGCVPRKKIRIRHYEKNLKEQNLEIKISSIEGRFKQSNPISKKCLENLFANGYYDNFYGVCLPRVEIEYLRSYFKFSDLRVTFDSNITYKEICSEKRIFEPKEVVEFKCSAKFSDEFIYSKINIPLIRFSKYCRAVQKIFSV